MSAPNLAALTSAAQDEVARQMQICNACRYCEGLCAVFPAMELRRTFEGGDTDYLANLCHNCGACHYDCQYAPPHEFAVNVPAAMAALREQSYARFAWPGVLAPLFQRNGTWIAAIGGASDRALHPGLRAPGRSGGPDGHGKFLRGDAARRDGRGLRPGLPLLALGDGAVAAELLAAGGCLRTPCPSRPAPCGAAARDAGKLRHLGGGGMGCMSQSERPDRWRRTFHHLTFYGFLLCFASTSSGTLMHYLLDWPAPYPWWAPPKLLGVPGGLGLVIGAARPDPARSEPRSRALARGAIGDGRGLHLDAPDARARPASRSTGCAETPAMGVLLAVHLGAVFAFFLTMPYGKFVHGLYRYAALVRHAHEQTARACSRRRRPEGGAGETPRLTRSRPWMPFPASRPIWKMPRPVWSRRPRTATARSCAACRAGRRPTSPARASTAGGRKHRAGLRRRGRAGRALWWRHGPRGRPDLGGAARPRRLDGADARHSRPVARGRRR